MDLEATYFFKLFTRSVGLPSWLGGKETQETPESLDQENPLQEEMTTQYSCLENPMDRGA